MTEEPTDERIAGFATKKYVLKVAHDVRRLGGHRSVCSTAPRSCSGRTEEIDLAVLPMDLRELHTGFDEVDLAVRQALSGVKGLPSRSAGCWCRGNTREAWRWSMP